MLKKCVLNFWWPDEQGRTSAFNGLARAHSAYFWFALLHRGLQVPSLISNKWKIKSEAGLLTFWLNKQKLLRLLFYTKTMQTCKLFIQIPMNIRKPLIAGKQPEEFHSCINCTNGQRIFSLQKLPSFHVTCWWNIIPFILFIMKVSSFRHNNGHRRARAENISRISRKKFLI